LAAIPPICIRGAAHSGMRATSYRDVGLKLCRAQSHWSWFRQSGCDENGTQEFSVSALQPLDFKTHTVQVTSRCHGGMNVKQQVLWLLVYHRFAPPQPCFSHSKGDVKQQLVNIWRCSCSRFLRKSLSLAPVAPRIPRYLLEVGAGPVQSLE